MSKYSIGDIVRIKETKTTADGKMAVVVNTGEEITTVRAVSNLRIALQEDKLEPMGESSIYEPGAGARLAEMMGHNDKDTEAGKAKAVAAVARRIELKRRRGMLIRLLIVAAIWLISGWGSAALWAATLCGAEGLAGWGLGLTALGYLATTPQMIGLVAACADDVKQMKLRAKGGK